MDKLNQQNQNWLDDNEDTMYQEDESNTIIRQPHRVILLSDVKAKLLEMQTEIDNLNKALFYFASKVNVDEKGQASFPLGYGKYYPEENIKNVLSIIKGVTPNE